MWLSESLTTSRNLVYAVTPHVAQRIVFNSLLPEEKTPRTIPQGRTGVVFVYVEVLDTFSAVIPCTCTCHKRERYNTKQQKKEIRSYKIRHITGICTEAHRENVDSEREKEAPRFRKGLRRREAHRACDHAAGRCAGEKVENVVYSASGATFDLAEELDQAQTANTAAYSKAQ